MLEKPQLDDGAILERVRDAYGLDAVAATFLPLGADVNTAVYRLTTEEGTAWFLKLRSGPFDEAAVRLPRWLRAQGVEQVLAPLETRDGRLWGELGAYRLILYPFVAGRDGYEAALTAGQWARFGAALRRLHSLELPAGLAALIPGEDFSPRWRAQVWDYLAQTAATRYADPLAARFAAEMNARREAIEAMLRRAEALAGVLARRDRHFVLCHSDVHPGNLLITGEEAFFLVDWDAPLLAPRERDLMLIGGTAAWSSAHQVELFFSGYGPGADPLAITYYRYERIIWDIAAEAEHVLAAAGGDEDRERSLHYFASNFWPGHELDLARAGDVL